VLPTCIDDKTALMKKSRLASAAAPHVVPRKKHQHGKKDYRDFLVRGKRLDENVALSNTVLRQKPGPPDPSRSAHQRARQCGNALGNNGARFFGHGSQTCVSSSCEDDGGFMDRPTSLIERKKRTARMVNGSHDRRRRRKTTRILGCCLASQEFLQIQDCRMNT
jgi:hypothetical protein